MSQRLDMSGSLNKNPKKKTEKSPDYVGNVMIEGNEYILVGWINENKETKKKFISLKVNTMDNEQNYSKSTKSAPPAKTVKKKQEDKPPVVDDDADELPF